MKDELSIFAEVFLVVLNVVIFLAMGELLLKAAEEIVDWYNEKYNKHKN